MVNILIAKDSKYPSVSKENIIEVENVYFTYEDLSDFDYEILAKYFSPKDTKTSQKSNLSNNDLRQTTYVSNNQYTDSNSLNNLSFDNSIKGKNSTSILQNNSLHSLASANLDDQDAESFYIDNLSKKFVLKNANLEIKRGDFVAILGSNGSGKSTLARHLNALLQGQAGKVLVLGMDTADESKHSDIHRLCGMVFQNPDNQIVGTTVEEDVAFGLENLAVPPSEIRQRVDASLALMQLEKMRLKSPDALSGGQKQKLALAGIIAMNPMCIILDESTSMLDPQIRKELLAFVHNLRKNTKLTVILVTHYMDEALEADKIYYLNAGEVSVAYRPEEFFLHCDLTSLSLDLPSSILICKTLSNIVKSLQEKNEHLFIETIWQLFEASNYDEKLKDSLGRAFFTSELLDYFADHFDFSDIEYEELQSLAWENQVQYAVGLLCVFAKNTRLQDFFTKLFYLLQGLLREQKVNEISEETVLSVEDLSYRYPDASEDEEEALKAVGFVLKRSECMAIAGKSGSGKSTLVLHLNGLIPTQVGKVKVFGLDTSEKKNLKAIRRSLGLLFQYPEHQLFAETLIEDIAFGPEALGYSHDEAFELARETAYLLGFTEEDLKKSPFAFSGGQMRKAALAGILSSKPEILLLDEPAAGLDPQSKKFFMSLVNRLKGEGKSIILVSHNVDDIAAYADSLLILSEGEIVFKKKIRSALQDRKVLRENSLDQASSQIFVDEVIEKFITEASLHDSATTFCSAKDLDLREKISEIHKIVCLNSLESFMKMIEKSLLVN